MAQYLDLTGLNLYDALIKELIKSGNNALAERIDEIVGGSDVDVSISEIVEKIGNIEGNKSIAQILDSLTNTVNTLNGDDKTEGSIKAEIKSLKTKHDEDIEFIRDYIAELLGGSDISGDDIISMSEVVASLRRLEEALGIEEGSDSEPSVLDRVDELEEKSVYVPSQSIQDAGMTSLKHEGLPATSAATFAERKYTYSEMFDMILFPTAAPVMTAPSLAWKNVSSQNVLVGSDITNLVITDDNLESHLTYNLGSWTYNSGMTASNGHAEPTYTKTNRPNPVDGVYIMPAKTITFKASVNYSAGDDPKNNKGEVQEGMGYAGGSKSTSNYTLTPYYNWYASTTSGGTLSVQPAITSCGIGTVKTGDTSKVASSSNGTLLAAHKYGVSEQMFSVPKQITEFWQFNTAANVWAQLELTDGVPAGWEMAQDDDETNGINYYTYTYKGPDNDPIYIIIKF